MKKETKREVPASSFRTFQKSFETVEKEQINVLDELQEDIKALSAKVDRSVDVNIELQAKIADMMTTMASLVDSFKEIAKFLRGGQAMPENVPTMEQSEMMAPSIEPVTMLSEEEVPEETETKKLVTRPDITSQLKELVNQNKELTDTLKNLEIDLKKSNTRELIKRAIEKSQTR